MAKIYVTNNHDSMLEFNLTSGGQAQVEPGATEYIDIADPNSAQNKGYAHVGLVTFSDKKADAAKAADAKPADSKSAGNSGALGGGQP